MGETPPETLLERLEYARRRIKLEPFERSHFETAIGILRKHPGINSIERLEEHIAASQGQREFGEFREVIETLKARKDLLQTMEESKAMKRVRKSDVPEKPEEKAARLEREKRFEALRYSGRVRARLLKRRTLGR